MKNILLIDQKGLQRTDLMTSFDTNNYSIKTNQPKTLGKIDSLISKTTAPVAHLIMDPAAVTVDTEYDADLFWPHTRKHYREYPGLALLKKHSHIPATLLVRNGGEVNGLLNELGINNLNITILEEPVRANDVIQSITHYSTCELA